MDDLSKEYIVSFFDKKLMLHGDTLDAVGWSSTGQILHYTAMLDAGDINNSKILDFGCGKGDLYGFLKVRGIQVKYTGFDINEKLIDLARRKYPDADFRVFDIDKDSINEDFDFIFLCGVFNVKFEGIEEAIKNTLVNLFKHCKRGLAFNALSSHDPRKDFELYYTSPEDLFDFARENLSPYVSIRQDRIPNNFTLFVYKAANFLTSDL